MNYNSIKQLAKDAGVSYRELIALTPQNDPFYVGTAGDWQKARWFVDVWHEAGFGGGVHLRRVHYWAVSREVGLPTAVKGSSTYRNSDACWKFLCQASKIARYLGLVSPDDISDNKNPDPHIFTALENESESSFYIDLPDLGGWYSHVDGFDAGIVQPYYLANTRMNCLHWPGWWRR